MATKAIEYAPKGLIGVLTPQANTTVEPEFTILCPPGYAIINARLTSLKPTIMDRLAEYFVTAERQLERFANAPVDAHAFACTGASYLSGRDAEDALVARAEAQTGRPFITAARAVSDALNALSARRIGLVSPYPPELNRTSVAYWTSRNFEVVEEAGNFESASTFHPIYSISNKTAGTAVRAMKTKEIDAIVMLGTGMPTLRLIRDAARIKGPPVLSSMLALAWRTVTAIDGRQSDRKNLVNWIAAEHWGQRLNAHIGM